MKQKLLKPLRLRVLMLVALLCGVLGMSNAWATAYKSYIDDKMQASTTISSSNVSSGSVGVISWTGAGCTYSSSRVNIEANGSITFTASPGYNITKIVIVSGSASAYYGTWTSSPIVTPKSESGTTTFEGLSANSVTVTTSTAFRCTSASYISIYYESASSTSACAIPTFSPEAGTYTSAQDVTINCATEDATIYYTTDGNDPTASSSIYSDPINVSETTTIKAIAIKDGMTNSAVATAEYVIKADYATLPFNWAGGTSATLAALDGVTSFGLGSDYAKDHAPYYVKFDGNGDYIQVKTDGQPGKVSIGVKMIGGANTSSITVQGSSDGEIFKDIETLSISGSQNDELTLTTTKGFEETDRYVRLVFTKGSNVGVGPISIAKPLSKHTATFYINGASSTAEIAEGSAITFPAAPDDINGKSFVGWTTAPINGTLDTAPETLVTSATMGTENVIYYAVFANVTPGTTQEVTDVLTRETTGASGTSYSNWSGKELSSSALYAGNSAGGNSSIQLRSGDNSGIIVTKSGGKFKKIVVDWNENTADGRSIRVYGKNTAYKKVSEVYSRDSQGKQIGGEGTEYDITYGKSAELTANEDFEYIGLRSMSNALYLNSISITWEKGTPATNSGYCTTVVAPVKPATPIIFHDSGEYESELQIAMAGEGTIKYTLNGGAEQTYTAPFTINETTTIKAWTEQDGAKSEVVEKTFTIVEKTPGAEVAEGYYTIKNNGNNKYVNVAGRKTVTFVDEAATATAAGTVIKVKAEADGVKVLRSQGVDVPGYADKAMRYVPEIVKLVVNKLNNLGEGQLMGEAGLEALMNKFNEAFDEHLYLEQAGENSYRIYGRTPSMKHVVDFYAENKANVDAKLPMLEGKINAAIEKVLEKTKGRGAGVLVPFSLETVWQNMDGTLTEPVDEASTMKFYEEVLSSETNVWNFAYQTAMIYWGNLKDNDTFKKYIGKLGDYAKYIDKVENIRPNFKYYIVQKDNKLDIISEGNGELNADFTAWTLTPRTDFSVAFNEENVLNNKYYTTLYTDFAYTLPEGEGVKAYKVTEVSKAGVAKKVEMEGTIPAQTPVLLEADAADTKVLTLNATDGTAPTDNLLVGADALINQYQIKTAQVEDLFNFAKDILGESFYNTYIQKYEHLMMRNAGTVNNKYFFGLTEDDLNLCTYKNENDENDCVVRSLSMGDEKLGFYNNWTAKANEAFLVSETFNPVKLTLKGDVNRDGSITIADVTALVNIILGKATYPADADKYDFEAAHVNADEDITIADVTALVNIILGKTQN